jgi:hypothetical protein
MMIKNLWLHFIGQLKLHLQNGLLTMPESFELPVWYNGKELMLPAELQAWSTSHRIIVTIEDFPFTFEPDEERNYRAVIAMEDSSRAEKIDRQLLQAIAETLHDLFAE